MFGDFVPVPAGAVDLDLADAHQRAAHAHTRQHLGRQRAGGDAGRRLAGGGAAAAAMVADAVFGIIGVVRMAGAVAAGDVVIVLGPLVHILDEHGHRRPGGHEPALGMGQGAREDAHLIRLAPLGGKAGGAGAAAVQRGLDVLHREAQAGGQPSTTQPMAGPWLSPKVVTRNIWPKVLKDIALFPILTPGAAAGQGVL